jgi:HTH-type transcriptional regulator/antitoxin HigA
MIDGSLAAVQNCSMAAEFRPSPSPGEQIQIHLDLQGWNQYDLAEILDVNQSVVSALINGKRPITLEIDRALTAAFGTPLGYWLKLETEFCLFIADRSTAGSVQDEVVRRAQLYKRAPVREMQRRGWIRASRNADELEAELSEFFSSGLCVSTRRSTVEAELTSLQAAWCHRARQMAAALQVAPYDPARCGLAEGDLRRLAAYPKEAKHLPKVLSNHGIRFVIVEPLTGAKIDGAAFWLDDDSPVIAVSARFDRIDAFWFTVMHEFSHIKHGDSLSVDTEIVSENGTGVRSGNEHETRANREAAEALVPAAELESFVRRLGPLYSKERIVQFAHRVKMHPGIIVGQLQHRGEIGYSAHRDLLAKVRSIVTETALTDGWGRTISPGIL